MKRANESSHVDKTETLSEDPKKRASQLDEIFRQAARDGSLYE